MARTTALILCAAALTAPGLWAQANILLYDDTGASSGFGLPYNEDFVTAITNLGHTYTLATNEGAFNSSLTGGTLWDLVILDVGNYPNALTTLDAIMNWFNTTGKPVIYGHWQASNYAAHPLFAQEGVVIGGSIGGAPPATIEDWMMGGGIFNSPNDVPVIQQGSSGMYGIYAQNSNTAGGAMAHGGYGGPTPTPNNCAVILGESRRFIFNAFALDPYSQRDGDMDGKVDIVELAENEIQQLLGPACGFDMPMSLDTVSDDVLFDFRLGDPEMDPLISVFEWSTDGGVTFQPCTEAPGSPLTNPAAPIGTPSSGNQFLWDSDVDGVGLIQVDVTILRIGVTDGTDMGQCTVEVEVDNVIPLPVCMITEPPGTQAGFIPFDLVLLSINSPVVNIVTEYSLDGGVTFLPATAAFTSPLPNPAMGVPVGLAQFVWDSRADGVATGGLLPGVLMRVTIDDGAAPPGVTLTNECLTQPFDVDNTSLCGGICGDCNLDGTGPNVIDALSAAQIAAGLVVPTMAQLGCCDVNASMLVDVIDALGMAQSAAGLPVALTCP